jgi:hypothetical protein
LIQAFVWNLGTCRPDVKGETQVGGPHERESTDAGHRGGAARSSNGLFVAVGLAGNIVTSPNGITWTSRDSGTTSGLICITYGNLISANVPLAQFTKILIYGCVLSRLAKK